MKETIEIFKGARNLLATGWTQGSYARDYRGNYVQFDDPTAVCFCASGAIYHMVAKEVTKFAHRNFEKSLAKYYPEANKDIVAWNDHPERTQDEVIDLFDKTIADLKNAC